MSLEEAILDKVPRLPPAKQEEVLRFADACSAPPQQEIAERVIEPWVAVDGDRLIAAGIDPLKVFAAAKAEGIQVPFVVHVLPEDPFPFVPGW